jgi:hypothetical protein
VLFEAIEQSLVGTAEADLISSLYEGCTAAAVQCTVCGSVALPSRPVLLA